MNELMELYLSWAKIGLFTFGGGYAMLPMIQKEIIEKHHWATEEEVMDYYAIGQCTPGVIAVNTATFIGYFRKGIIGAICATLGVITPSIIIILLIASVLTNFQDLVVVQHALAGIRIAVCVLMVASIIKLLKGSVKDPATLIFFGLALAITYLTNLSTIVIVVIGAVAGVIVSTLKRRAGQSS